ncbi:High mobility group protein D [Operophtera brumata]|uniref:High mobility group protein D n=1 Tax=Operophtera brumata TaxID=104452 RepID=A0A0L7KNL4_OPEBR|nr:High mobility group protein D [Operophtera brumata]
MLDKPKRPMSAYLLWLNSARQKIKADFPGLKVTEVAKKGGEMWRGMEDKSEWEAMAAKAKEQYTKDLESFNANGGDAAPVAKKAQKRGKKPRAAAPKKKQKEELDEDDDDEEDEASD